MRIVGIDPGTRHMGWGVVWVQGSRLFCEGCGVLHTDTKEPLASRLVQIDQGLRELLEHYKPEVGAVEALFYAKDAQAASKLGHARGVVLLNLSLAGLEVFEYEPARVKRTVTGRGRADKKQVAMMVKALLRLDKLPSVDATDALAVAITHARYARFDKALRRSTRG